MLIQITTESLALMLSSKLKVSIAFFVKKIPYVEFVKCWQTVHADVISRAKCWLAINLGTLDCCFSCMFCLLTDLFIGLNGASSFSYSKYKILVQLQNTKSYYYTVVE